MQQAPTREGLVRGIRRWDLVFLVLNAIIGAGIFGLPARVYAIAGTWSLVAYVACAALVALIILCFAEVASHFSTTGGPYLYAHQAFGPMAGFQMGWLLWIARLTAFAALCNLWLDYLAFFLPGVNEGTMRAVSITLISLLFNSMAGYAFARLRFRGRDRGFAFLIAALAIPVQISMLPLFLLMKWLHLVNTYWGVIIPGMASILGIFLVRQFMLSIPQDLLDAARIDGAGEWKIYWSIVLPLAKPVLVTLAIFTFMNMWNDFMWPLIILTDSDRYTLPVAIANLVGEHVMDVELMMASSVLTVTPVLVLFLALQRYYIAGLMSGSVK